MINNVERGPNGHWRVAQTINDKPILCVFPEDTLEWRAAEYGIDPNDTATLLDIVLTEPFLTPEDWANGPTLYDADTIDDARTAHIARCAAVKLRHRISTREKNSPVSRVRDESPMNPEAIALKTQYVAQRRNAANRQRHQQRTVPNDADRVRRLRRDLLGPMEGDH